MKTSLPAEGILFPPTDLWIPNLEQHHYLSTDAKRKLQRALRKYAAEEWQWISLLKTQKELDMAD